MKKNVMFLFIFVFLLSGCSGETSGTGVSHGSSSIAVGYSFVVNGMIYAPFDYDDWEKYGLLNEDGSRYEPTEADYGEEFGLTEYKGDVYDFEPTMTYRFLPLEGTEVIIMEGGQLLNFECYEAMITESYNIRPMAEILEGYGYTSAEDIVRIEVSTRPNGGGFGHFFKFSLEDREELYDIFDILSPLETISDEEVTALRLKALEDEFGEVPLKEQPDGKILIQFETTEESDKYLRIFYKTDMVITLRDAENIPLELRYSPLTNILRWADSSFVLSNDEAAYFRALFYEPLDPEVDWRPS